MELSGASGGQAVWCGVSSDAGVAPKCCGEEGAETVGKAFD